MKKKEKISSQDAFDQATDIICSIFAELDPCQRISFVAFAVGVLCDKLEETLFN